MCYLLQNMALVGFHLNFLLETLDPLAQNRLSQGRSKRRKWSRFMIPLKIQMNRHPCLPALRMGVLGSFKGCLLSKNTYL